jgi:glycosyltransferase involved in cell wall biosynthesis
VKKLLIVHNFYKEFGGEDANIYEEIEFFKKKYEISFFYQENKHPINIFDIFSFIFQTNFSTNKKFLNIVEEFQPDIVYIHNTWFKVNLGIFKILKIKKIKVILKIHNLRYECGRHLFAKQHSPKNKRCDACGFEKPFLFFLNKYYKDSYIKSIFLYLYSLKFFDILKNYPLTLLALNDFHKRKLIEKGVAEEKIEVFHNPIKLDQDSTKDKYSYLVYAGRISKEKGVEEVIKSWLNSAISHFDLYIIGDGELKSYLEKKYRYKNLIFMGYLSNEEVLGHIKHAKAVVTATKLYEGQPRLLCEASSLGTISIYPSFGGMNEFFPEDYKYSFEQFNYTDLEKKLSLLNKDIIYEKAVIEVKNNILEKLNEKNLYLGFSRILDS